MKKVTKRIKIIGKVLYWTVFAVLIAIAAIVAIAAIDIPGNYKLLSVQSGSMEPSLPRGSVVVTKPLNEYRIGDVISYYDSDKEKYLITHRIAGIESLENSEFFITKGDANDDADRDKVDRGLVVGKVIWALPFLGYIVSFAKTQIGLIALVIIPATLIISSELLAIKREIKKLKSKSRGSRKIRKRFYFPKIIGLIILFSLVKIGATSSTFVDIETSVGNVMTAGVWGEEGEEVGVDSEESEVELLFYLREDARAVGFIVQGVSGYDSLDYVIEYKHDGGILEHIEGTIDNSGHSDAFLREWFELGTCSDGGLVCVYHEDIPEVNLEIDLLIGGVIDDTLQRSITF